MKNTRKTIKRKLLPSFACVLIIVALGIMTIIGMQVRTSPTIADASEFWPPVNDSHITTVKTDTMVARVRLTRLVAGIMMLQGFLMLQ